MVWMLTRVAALLSCLALFLPCGMDGRVALPCFGNFGTSLALVLSAPLHPSGEPREADGEESSPEPVEESSPCRTHRQATVRVSQPTFTPALLSQSAAGHGLCRTSTAAVPGGSPLSCALHLFHCVWLC